MRPNPVPPDATTAETTTKVQTGVRMEKRMVKVLKALAEYYDVSLGDFLEALVLASFAGTKPFTDDGLSRVADIMRVYGMTLGASPTLRS